ncbi:MAG TPA: ABC transporter permease [Chloroflexota bacterium]|nr:ABC transporter permease [Chloroflexota bacterium]
MAEPSAAAVPRGGQQTSRAMQVGTVLVSIVVLTALVSLVWTPHPPGQQDLNRSLLPPAWLPETAPGFPLGTDLNGRDLLSRIMVGARASLFVGLASVLVGGLIGVTLGLSAGYFGGWVDALIMRLVDIQLSLPGVLLAVALLAAIGKGLLNVVLVLGFVSWVQYARLVRGSTLGARAQDYVLSARALGASHTRIMARHILPNIAGPLLVVATINISTNILSEEAHRDVRTADADGVGRFAVDLPVPPAGHLRCRKPRQELPTDVRSDRFTGRDHRQRLMTSCHLEASRRLVLE